MTGAISSSPAAGASASSAACGASGASGASGPSGASGTSATPEARAAYKAENQGKSIDQLVDQLGNKNLADWQKDVLKDLIKEKVGQSMQAGAPQQAAGAGDKSGAGSLLELLMKLLSGEISPEEFKEQLKAMGLSEDQINALMEALQKSDGTVDGGGLASGGAARSDAGNLI